MLRIEHLSKAYGEKKAVDDLNLHIATGEIYGFIGHNGAGKTKQLIELVHASVAEEGGCVVCIEPGADMTYDIKSSVRLRRSISGLHAGNHDISHVYVDNLCKIVHSEDFAAVEKFLHWLDKFSDANTVKFTVTLTADASVATEGMRKYQ